METVETGDRSPATGDRGSGQGGTGSVPAPHAEFLARALPVLQSDARLVGVAAGGSYVSGGMDEFSDLDLVIAVEPGALAAVLAERQAIAAKLGPLLVGFTGEHVGEPRLLICLYGPPPLHVDLKFVALPDLAQRVEDPVVLWERDGRVGAALAAGVARYPEPDPQWIEDRFWVWVHYGAAKLGRGELFEALGMLTFLQQQVLGPLALRAADARPSGVRKLEHHAAQFAVDLRATVASHDAIAIAKACLAAVELYRRLRAASPPAVVRVDAEREAVGYLERVV